MTSLKFYVHRVKYPICVDFQFSIEAYPQATLGNWASWLRSNVFETVGVDVEIDGIYLYDADVVEMQVRFKNLTDFGRSRDALNEWVEDMEIELIPIEVDS